MSMARGKPCTLQIAVRCSLRAAGLFAALVVALPTYAEGARLEEAADAADIIKRFEARTTRFTAGQPHWPGPIFTSVPMLAQVFRYDFGHLTTSAGVDTWNVGVSKGLQIVQLPRTEFTFAPPSVISRNNNTSPGIGDLALAVKYRITARDETHGNYILSALLTGTVPTGNNTNGTTEATLSPQLVGGKGWGKTDVVVALAGMLPLQGTTTIGRTIAGNVALQYHLSRYVWPELESNTTAYFGSSRDGNTQSFLSPGIVIGRLPYTAHEQNRRRGWSIGAGMQFAVTPFHTYDHNIQITTRIHF